MSRRLGFVLVCLFLLAWAPAAPAAYPGPVATQGGPGVLSHGGTLRLRPADAVPVRRHRRPLDA